VSSHDPKTILCVTTTTTLGCMLWILFILSRVSPPEVAPPLFLPWWWQLVIHGGLCEIVIKLVQHWCVLDSFRESLSLDHGPCGYGWEFCIGSSSQFCKVIPSIHAAADVLLIKGIILVTPHVTKILIHILRPLIK
jgi:hypothetical protein